MKRGRIEMTKAIREHYARIGAKGGTAGTGAAKQRGGSKYYAAIARARWGKRRKEGRE